MGTRRMVVAIIAAAVVGSTLMLGSPALAAPDEAPASETTARVGAEEDLGYPIDGKVLSPESSLGTDADGTPLAFWVTNGNAEVPAMFQVTEALPRTAGGAGNQVIFKQRVPAGVNSWANTFNAVNGTVYFGMTEGQLYSWKPGDEEITDHGTPFPGQQIWRLATAPDGTVYGGTYPGGRLFSFDPATGQTADLGQVNAGETYLRSLAIDDDYVYAGSQPNAKLARYDRHTGEVTDIPIPIAGQGTTYDMTLAGGYLFVRVEPFNTLIVYDTSDLSVVNTVPKVTGRVISQADPSGKSVWFRLNNGVDPVGIYRYDLEMHTYSSLGFNPNAFPGAWMWYEDPDQETWPGMTAIMTYYNGRIYTWNETKRKGLYFGEADLESTPNPIQTIGAGPDGNLYISGFLSPPGMSRFDPATDQYTLLAGAGQIEGIGTFGDSLVLGRYPKADLLRYDTTQPWANGTNPAAPVSIGDEQDRPHSLVRVGDRMAVSTVPVSGRLGGAITLWDPATGDTDVHRNLVPDQGVVSLAERDGLIYAGTTINGGYGTEPTATEAELFAFDPETGDVVYRTVPVPGAVSVNALTFDEDGVLWGIADGYLFSVDPVDGTVIRTEQVFPHRTSMYAADRAIVFRDDGYLYATASGSLWRVDPGSFTAELLADDGAGHLTEGSDGNLYYARVATLYRWNFALGDVLPARWDGNAVYDTGDEVRHSGSTWRASWWTQNQEPGDPWGPWQEIAETEDGIAQWTPSRIFVTGDTAVHEGATYTAKWWTRNQKPGDPSGPWQPTG